MPFSSSIRSLIIFVSLLITFLVACQKTPVDPNSTTNPATSTELLYPKTIHFVKSPQAHAGQDLTHYIEYNALKKISKITVLESADLNKVNKIVNFSYNAAGQLNKITTYGSPYFYIPFYQKPNPAQFFTHSVKYSPQQVDVMVGDSVQSVPPRYTIKYDQNGNIVQFNSLIDGNYTFDITPDKQGNASSYTYTYRNGSGSGSGPITISRSADLNTMLSYRTDAVHPFVNTPELRLYSLLRDEADYGYYEEDLLLQNHYCLSVVTNGLLTDARFTRLTTPYASTVFDFVVNDKGYATTLKATAAGTLVRYIDVTYTTL